MSLSPLTKTLAALLISASTLMGTSYNVDLSHSSVSFKVRHMMVSNVKGHFNDFSGTYKLENGVLTSLSGTVALESVDTGIEKRDKHLRNEDFFNVEKNPEMTFEMTRKRGNSVEGKLTLNGVTKTIKLDADVSGEIKDPWGNQRSGMSLEGKISRSDYGLTWNKMMEAGGVVVGDEIKLMIELEGIAE
ncbi:MAG: YceI family protein [Campylobacterota bacterium]|nr:YceI family protein [Campylobacterota bacterium]